MEQYLFHAVTNIENPVLLFLHGGPGESFSLFSHLFQQLLEEIYTIVHWDAYFPTIDSLLQDLYETIQY